MTIERTRNSRHLMTANFPARLAGARAAQTFVPLVAMIAPVAWLFWKALSACSMARLLDQPAIEHRSP
jgi:hypothetical protein